MTDDLICRAKIATVMADDLIYRLSNVKDYFDSAISSLNTHEWDDHDIRSQLEKAETKAKVTGDFIGLVRGYRRLAREHAKKAKYWRNGKYVTSPSGAKYHDEMARTYSKAASKLEDSLH